MTQLPDEPAASEKRRIAHDLSNWIMVVQGNLELIRMSLPREGKLGSRLELACDAAERCRILTERLCAVSKEPER